ncbi:unnamed protein product [Nezara viridula]|uniref:Uncharacterized protein n=1 Tax=Nezara viridula TaxID=85310 RepID=A0A9P0MK66_NEZVI|nr:unnamed protein product [Nezara viridula]
MSIEEPFDDPKYRGFQKYFNSYTIRGRSNWAKLWLSVYAGGFVLYKVIK